MLSKHAKHKGKLDLGSTQSRNAHRDFILFFKFQKNMHSSPNVNPKTMQIQQKNVT